METRLDYCQYLLSSPLNYTLTHFADHSDRFTDSYLDRHFSSGCVRSGNGNTARCPEIWDAYAP